MPGPRCCCCFFITTLTALLSSSNAFSLGLPRQVKPLGPPLVYLLQEEGPTQPRSIQKVLRTKRNSLQELVQTQPHQGQYTGRPETHKASRSQEMDTADLQLLSQPAMEENLGVEDEMERMIHLVVPQKEPSYRGPPDSSDPEKEPLAGPGAGDASLEASGYYGTDMEDRDRGEDEGEDRERRGGEEWEIDVGEDKERTGEDDDTHTSPDQEALIGSRRSNHTGPPAEGRDPGLQEQRGALVLKAERDLWEEDAHSSGDGDLHPSAPAATGGTPPPETDTGTDFGLLEGYTEDVQDEETERDEEEDQEAALPHRDAVTQNPTEAEVMVAPTRGFLQPRVEEEEEQEVSPLTAGPSPSFTEPSRDWLETTTSSPESEVRGSRASEVTGFDELEERQVTCVDWSKLSQQGSVLLNTTENLSCEEFRVACGVRLLKVIEGAFAQRMNSPEGSWQVHLNKPTHQLQQLMMNVVSEHGVMATKEVLSMLGEIRRMLNQVGIQTFSSPSTCRTGRSPTRSDYGKLFVVLVIIGSVCMIIITSGFLYICWQRHLPGTKTTFRAEELHFVENSCHDNPTLDVTNDNQPEMREKKPTTNGLAAGGIGGGAESSRWKVFVNQAATEEEEEQDTHL
uniref:podocalyxin-like protein 2 n=1 Tax=Gasterosteus aculeatus aculeatus TaxID=481459 RepID=UPI001A98809C|nr:podocalyxin-like protein 2 [Gasterosteus aculeatus aculeatus]